MPKKATESYKELEQRLDELVAKLQDPGVSIDHATQYYEQALKLISKMEKQLEQAENQVYEIRAQFAK